MLYIYSNVIIYIYIYINPEACLRHLTGLLKVRGELKKSDVVATSLAIQSLQELILATRRTRIRLVVWWLGKPWENHGKMVIYIVIMTGWW